MRVGTPVTYITAEGTAHSATVTALVGAGPSGYKTLAISLGEGETVEAVPHAGDAQSGEAHWTLDPVMSASEKPRASRSRSK